MLFKNCYFTWPTRKERLLQKKCFPMHIFLKLFKYYVLIINWVKNKTPISEICLNKLKKIKAWQGSRCTQNGIHFLSDTLSFLQDMHCSSTQTFWKVKLSYFFYWAPLLILSNVLFWGMQDFSLDLSICLSIFMKQNYTFWETKNIRIKK